MGKIIEILEAERKRPTAADFDVVHMYKTGQFYTAYDWSAWIISVISYTDAVRMQTKDRHPLAVTRIKIATSEQTFCKVGVDACREWLLEQVPKVREFLADELGLQLHMGKLHVREVSQGVEFLGAFVKPYRDYISNKTLARIEENVKTIDLRDIGHAEASINSYMGVLSHSASYNIRQHLFEEIDGDIIKAA